MDARVHLLVRPLDIEVIKRKAELTDGEHNWRLAHMYLDYVVTNPQMHGRASYAKVRSDAEGHFQFTNLPPARWYYVTAQALGSAMVSWQVAVFLKERERVQVVLTNTNAVLPIYFENTNGSHPENRAFRLEE